MKILKKIDVPLFIVMILLIAIGIVMIFSASNVAAIVRYNQSPLGYFIKQSIWALIALIAFFIIIFIDSKYYKNISIIALIAIIISLIYLIFKGTFINKTRGWLLLFNGKIGFQPSELFKIFYIVLASFYYDKFKNKLDDPKYLAFPILLGFGGAGLVFLQPDFGTAMVISVVTVFLFFINPVGKQIKSFVKIFMFLIIIIALLALPSIYNKISKEKQNRLNTRGVCTQERFYTDGNQLCNSLIAFNNGGLFGKGLANSSQKYLYLPESHTDFIFPVIVEELGIIGGIVIILLFMFMFYRIMLIAKSSYHNYQASYSYAIMFLMALHLFVNIGGVSTFIPLTGIPIPFLSYGGTSLVFNVIALAFIQRARIETRLRKERFIKKKV
ncbi:MAG: FtsW/RodA/SpoVE family cell cycle protein [Clostridiales bacterium]|nr:FtsW/RodA/SpoVE family cell cycle protein [Clostridiales bacterium]